MLVKCGREEFDLTKDDEIMYNGACYQVITRTSGFGWNKSTPVLAKGKAEKLIKDGLLVFDRDRTSYGITVSIYKIAE
jgi:hypothetical protein